DADVSGLVRKVAGDRITCFRQPTNAGSLRNFHTCLERSRGRLIHLLHGDDLVRPGFYEKMENLFAQYPSIGAAFCRFAYINEAGRTLFHQDPEMKEAGILESGVSRLSEKQRIQYVARVVRRDVYKQLGGFYGVEYGEDWEMWVRIAARYPVGYTPEVLAEYRKHYNSVSGNAFVTGANMRSLEWAMERIQQYLPADERARILGESRRFYAHYALRVANSLWMNFKDRRAASVQVAQAWKMSRDANLVYKILKLYTKIILNI
ncbi:MAG TPA: glycosyltransferase, partial [Chryseosolibacter sp.]